MSEDIPSLIPTSASSHTSVPYTPRQYSIQISDFFSPKAFQLGEEAYIHYYLTLKSQRTILQGILKKISDDIPQSSVSLTPPHQQRFLLKDKDQLPIKIFRDFLNSFLNCSYGELLIVTAAATDAIQPIMRNQNISDNVKKIAHRLMNSVLAINHLLTSIQNEYRQCSTNNIESCNSSNLQDNSKIASNKSGDNKIDDDDPDDSSPKEEICRICNEYVPIELFEEHIKYCKQAYEAESKLRLNQTEITYTQNVICEDYLGISWPGERKEAEKTILPMLRVSLLLERAYQIDPKSDDAVDEFQYICDVLNILFVGFMGSNCQKIIGEAREQILLKAQLSGSLYQAAEVLKKTRISGNDDTQKIAQIQISDFEFKKRISAGAFARVFVAQKKLSNDIYAIKVLSKDDVIQKNQVRRVVLEKDILLQFNNPYIINFYYSISGTRNLYLVMEYLPGGDLYSMLHNLGSMPEYTAKIYTYQIAVALSYLHSKGIIHRDIKPDNVLVTATGRVKLTDFGLSYVGITDRNKKVSLNNKEGHIRHSLSTENRLGRRRGLTYFNPALNEKFNLGFGKNVKYSDNDDEFKTPDDEKLTKTRSIVGTPDYIAPEIIEGKEHTFAVDWWSLGAVLYEFLFGRPPFHAETKEKVYENIKACNYTFPISNNKNDNNSKNIDNNQDDNEKEEEEEEEAEPISDDALDLISKLLTLDPSKRLGSNSSDEVIHHKWFNDIDPSNLTIPFTPELQSEIDTTYFTERYTFKDKDDSDILADIRDAERSTSNLSSPFGYANRIRKRSMTQSAINESILVPNEANSPPSPTKGSSKNENDNSEVNIRQIINSCSYDNLPIFAQDEPSNIENLDSNASKSSSIKASNSCNNINTNNFYNSINEVHDNSSSNNINIKSSSSNMLSNSSKIDNTNSNDQINLICNGNSDEAIKYAESDPFADSQYDKLKQPFGELMKLFKNSSKSQTLHSTSQIPIVPYKSSLQSSFHRFTQNLLSESDKENDQPNNLSGSDKNSMSNSSTPSILSAGPSDTNLRSNPQSMNSDFTDNDSDISSFPIYDFESSNVEALQVRNKELLKNRRSTTKSSKEDVLRLRTNSFATMETQNKESKVAQKRLSSGRIHMMSADDMCLPKYTGREKHKSSYSKSNENSIDYAAQNTNTDSMENQNKSDENHNLE